MNRDYLKRAIDLNVAKYHATREERRRLFHDEGHQAHLGDWYWCLEVLMAEIAGCAYRVVGPGRGEDPHAAMLELKQMARRRIELMPLLIDLREHYPLLAAYAEYMDYLRLLAIEHAEAQLSERGRVVR